ncbi:hypothetical protein AsAng_0062620 [Aureispira anguillae]|uniref:Uncharacterized protein n=1 Tax=Aureispira anguillae TaxID=2864201 RepID=A0A915YLL6_9BACT|nr:hypothetical protein AsAng_0062620 [Aureispira anguillae]
MNYNRKIPSTVLLLFQVQDKIFFLIKQPVFISNHKALRKIKRCPPLSFPIDFLQK